MPARTLQKTSDFWRKISETIKITNLNFFSKFPAEISMKRGENGLKTPFFEINVSPTIFPDELSRDLFYLLFIYLFIYFLNHPIFKGNFLFRYALQSKLHQIFIKSIRSDIKTSNLASLNHTQTCKNFFFN